MVKNPPANAEDTGDADSIPGSGRSPGEGNGNPLQYSFLENPIDRRAWQATVHGVAIVRHDLATKPPPPHPSGPPVLSAASLLLLLLSHFSRVRLCDPIDSSPPARAMLSIQDLSTLDPGLVVRNEWWVCSSWKSR